MAVSKDNAFYPTVLNSNRKLNPLQVDEAFKTAFDLIYSIAPPPGSGVSSILSLSNVNLNNIGAAKILSGMIPAGETITFAAGSIATPTAAKLVFENTGSIYANKLSNLLFVVPTTDKKNFLYLGSNVTGDTYRWKSINLLTDFTNNSSILLRSVDDAAGDSSYRITSGVGSTNHVWNVGGTDLTQLVGTVFSPAATGGCSLGSAGLKWSDLFLTNPLGVAYGGTALTTVPTNGKLLIGNGTNYTLATITGTANQVIVTNGAGSITLSTPQDIGTTSTPTFNNLIVTTQLQCPDLITASNIDLFLDPQGSGVVKFGSYTVSAGAPVTGYITVKDSGGTTRHLAVV